MFQNGNKFIFLQKIIIHIMKIQKRFLIIGSLVMILSVGLGAFAAHGLKPLLDAYQIDIFETGVRYQFYHGLGLLLLVFLAEKISLKKINRIGWLFTIGILFFSGSLYLLATKDLLGINAFFLGPITPLGGTLFIVGWTILLIEAIKMKVN